MKEFRTEYDPSHVYFGLIIFSGLSLFFLYLSYTSGIWLLSIAFGVVHLAPLIFIKVLIENKGEYLTVNDTGVHYRQLSVPTSVIKGFRISSVGHSTHLVIDVCNEWAKKNNIKYRNAHRLLVGGAVTIPCFYKAKPTDILNAANEIVKL